MTWARLSAGVAALAGVWVATAPLVHAWALRLELLTVGGVATGGAIVCCALGVIGLSRGRQAGARLAGLVVLLLTLVGFLVHQPAVVATGPGLMIWEIVTRHGWIDYASAQALLACAVALFIPLRSGSPRLRDASNAFAAAALLAGGAARLSGIVAVGGLAWEPFAGMPATVAVGAIGLGSGLLFVRRGAALLGAPVAGWRQMPMTVAIAIAALTFVLWRSLSMERAQGTAPMEHREVVALTTDVRRALETHAGVMKRLAYMPATSPADWARRAHAQLATAPALAAVAWVEPSLTTRIEVGLDPNRRNAIDLKAMPAGRVAVRGAKGDQTVVVSRPVDLDVQGDACLILVPTPAAAPEPGLIAGLVRYHELFASIASVRRVGIEIVDASAPIYRSGPERPRGSLAWTPLALPSAPEWRLRAWRGGSRLVPADGMLPEIVLGIGLLLAILAGLGTHFVDEGGRRAKAARRVNNDLRKEIERRRQRLGHVLRLENDRGDLPVPTGKPI